MNELEQFLKNRRKAEDNKENKAANHQQQYEKAMSGLMSDIKEWLNPLEEKGLLNVKERNAFKSKELKELAITIDKETFIYVRPRYHEVVNNCVFIADMIISKASGNKKYEISLPDEEWRINGENLNDVGSRFGMGKVLTKEVLSTVIINELSR